MNKLSHLIAMILVLPIRFYQICISPLLGPSCRFTPTCSEYAKQAMATTRFLERNYKIKIK